MPARGCSPPCTHLSLYRSQCPDVDTRVPWIRMGQTGSFVPAWHTPSEQLPRHHSISSYSAPIALARKQMSLRSSSLVPLGLQYLACGRVDMPCLHPGTSVLCPRQRYIFSTCPVCRPQGGPGPALPAKTDPLVSRQVA